MLIRFAKVQAFLRPFFKRNISCKSFGTQPRNVNTSVDHSGHLSLSNVESLIDELSKNKGNSAKSNPELFVRKIEDYKFAISSYSSKGQIGFLSRVAKVIDNLAQLPDCKRKVFLGFLSDLAIEHFKYLDTKALIIYYGYFLAHENEPESRRYIKLFENQLIGLFSSGISDFLLDNLISFKETSKRMGTFGFIKQYITIKWLSSSVQKEVPYQKDFQLTLENTVKLLCLLYERKDHETQAPKRKIVRFLEKHLYEMFPYAISNKNRVYNLFGDLNVARDFLQIFPKILPLFTKEDIRSYLLKFGTDMAFMVISRLCPQSLPQFTDAIINICPFIPKEKGTELVEALIAKNLLCLEEIGQKGNLWGKHINSLTRLFSKYTGDLNSRVFHQSSLINLIKLSTLDNADGATLLTTLLVQSPSYLLSNLLGIFNELPPYGKLNKGMDPRLATRHIVYSIEAVHRVLLNNDHETIRLSSDTLKALNMVIRDSMNIILNIDTEHISLNFMLEFFELYHKVNTLQPKVQEIVQSFIDKELIPQMNQITVALLRYFADRIYYIPCQEIEEITSEIARYKLYEVNLDDGKGSYQPTIIAEIAGYISSNWKWFSPEIRNVIEQIQKSQEKPTLPFNLDSIGQTLKDQVSQITSK